MQCILLKGLCLFYLVNSSVYLKNKYKQIALINKNGIKPVKNIKWNIESKRRWAKEIGRICKRVENQRNRYEKTVPRKAQDALRFSIFFFSKSHSFIFPVSIQRPNILLWFQCD